jgi:hypothetical protein
VVFASVFSLIPVVSYFLLLTVEFVLFRRPLVASPLP